MSSSLPCLLLRLWLGCFWSVSHQAAPSSKNAGVRVGTAAVELVAVQAIKQANAALSKDSLEAFFHLGREETVGKNSRQMLIDGSIYWIGRREFVRPTGPFDSQLSVMGFRSKGFAGDPAPWKALWFNQSTHTIGTFRSGVRSPSFYGLAAQQLESDLGAHVLFLEGASGSTHNLDLPCQEATHRMVNAVQGALNAMQPAPMQHLATIKRSFTYRVRHFDEAAEHQLVTDY